MNISFINHTDLKVRDHKMIAYCQSGSALVPWFFFNKAKEIILTPFKYHFLHFPEILNMLVMLENMALDAKMIFFAFYFN